MPRRLAYLGPPGTYSEDAGLAYDPQATCVPYNSIPAIGTAVAAGLADEGIVPIENSLEGSVSVTLDLLIHDSSLSIRNELVLPIHHCLLAAEGTKTEQIKVVYSNPQPLEQCREFLAKCFPEAELVASLSTSAAVKEVLERKKGAAAIASLRAATIYGARVLAQGIEDNPNNVTRFVILAPGDHEPTGADRTSICFSFDEDAPGLLYDVMGEFARRDINLAKVESRPTKQSLGRYIFLIDLEGHREDDAVREALDKVKSRVSVLKIFGSYPRYTAGV